MDLMAYTLVLVACGVMLYAIGEDMINDYLYVERFAYCQYGLDSTQVRECYLPLLPADDRDLFKLTIHFLEPVFEEMEACALDVLEVLHADRVPEPVELEMDIFAQYILGEIQPPVWIDIDVSDFDEPYFMGLEGSLFMSDVNYLESPA